VGTLVLTDPVNGTTVDAALHANNNTALKAVVNGGIDNSNVSGSAGIVLSKWGQSGAATGNVPVWTGAAWVAQGGAVPTGALVAWSTNSAPTGYLICDGSSQLRASFAALFAVIGVTYGSVDGTHFNVPDLKNRVPVGRNSGQVEFDTLGETGGETSHTLTVAEMPSHAHGGVTGGSASYFTNTGGARDTPTSGSTFSFAASHTHTITAEGGGAGHNNLQPYLVINYIIKT
jgi:microcystin-dependent protein